MKREYFIGLDTHGTFCEMAVVTGKGNLVRRGRCDTTIEALRKLIAPVPAPRHVVMEEGPLANWLYRNLKPHVTSLTVSDPRRNRLICCEGDKDDAVDALQLAQLLRGGGLLKPVHQTETLSESVFKQLVGQYHRRVRRRVAAGLQITALLKQHGVIARAKQFSRPEDQANLLKLLPANQLLAEMILTSCAEHEQLQAAEEVWYRRLVMWAKKDATVVRFTGVPGISWVRASTLRVYLDTPWRFRSKKALWKYLGIGLERRTSGNGPELLGVPKRTHRLLKSTILGAAQTAATRGENPFAVQYRRWIDNGLSLRLAKRNVARSLSSTLWGMWKQDADYEPEWVGRNGSAAAASESY